MTEFLLNPNFAYLLIVAGFLLTVFAILTPGTGFFEVGALFILVFVGWQVFNIPINLWALILLVLGIVPFIFAIGHKRETLNLALTALAFVVGSAFLFRSEDWWRPAVHPVLAVVVSVLAGGFFWLMTTKVLEARAKVTAHDLGSLIGATGEARTDVHAEGSVYVKGETWTAHSEKIIKAGSRVKVLAREGLSLFVEKID
ncbi:MAG: NfeD family protein [Anaerolineales bacterium]|jgi:membrane-bound serine protease (ClpP class)